MNTIVWTKSVHVQNSENKTEYIMASWYSTCFSRRAEILVFICLQAPVKLKLKMRKDLSDKEITDISVSSTSLTTEFAAYFQSLKSTGKFAAFANKCTKMCNKRTKSLHCSLYLSVIIFAGLRDLKKRNIANSKTLERKLPRKLLTRKPAVKPFYYSNVSLHDYSREDIS